MKISIADVNSNAEALADFFHKNLTLDYISHSELQGYRAVRPGMWAPNIATVLQSEIQERLGQPLEEFPVRRDWRGVIVGQEDNKIVGLALVTSSFQCTIPHGIIEDIVIESTTRDRGQGKTMMTWIADRFRHAGINRLFLESGLGNDRAHHFFERFGFRQVSIVMMAETTAI